MLAAHIAAQHGCITVREVRPYNPDALEDRGAALLCPLEQDQVELAAVDVKGVIPIDSRLVALLEENLRRPEVVGEVREAVVRNVPRLRRCPCSTVLLRESCCL